MAKELFRPQYAPPGMKYADARKAGLLRESLGWWIRVRHSAHVVCGCRGRDGKPLRGVPHTFRESTKTDDKPTAKAALDAHRKALINDQRVIKRADQPTFGEVATDLRRNYELMGQHLGTLAARLLHLEPAFGHRKMVDICSTDANAYKYQRHKEGATNGTINRELAVIKRAFTYAIDEMKVPLLIPRIKMLREAPARSGFFSAEGYAAVLRHLPSDAHRLACAIMHTYGWRKGEVMTLQRGHVDMDFGTLSLSAGTTKNDDPRIVPLTPALRAAIAQQIASLDAWQDRTGRRTRYIFTHTFGRHEGKPILDFVRAWHSACLEAQLDLDGATGEARERRKAELLAHPEGLVKAIRHDFRRTAIRNLLDSGTDESVAMKITGHRSANVFKRYRIANLADVERAVARLSQNENGSNHRNGRLALPSGMVHGQE